MMVMEILFYTLRSLLAFKSEMRKISSYSKNIGRLVIKGDWSNAIKWASGRKKPPSKLFLVV